MTKTTILAFSVVLVLVIGIVSAEQAFAPMGGQGGKKVTITEHVIRFDVGNHQTINSSPGFFINGNYEGTPNNGFIDFRRGSTLVGLDGEITELRYDIGAGTLNGFTTTASLWKNNVVIGSCSVVTTTTPTSCVVNLSESVSAGDLIAVSHVSPAGNIGVEFFHAVVVLKT